MQHFHKNQQMRLKLYCVIGVNQGHQSTSHPCIRFFVLLIKNIIHLSLSGTNKNINGRFIHYQQSKGSDLKTSFKINSQLSAEDHRKNFRVINSLSLCLSDPYFA